ncbi:MAG: phosphodiester glycosidase family protein [Clostridiales bacterium]|nr:phosphodiester glycosidase family protein [Clostridiales bacterium]MDO4351034.1 phosphodiester glycosidase family protein [Eubacteriales bacterium]MDY4008723.1 phosphodiester glycosidase family protein [Candidatus Limiplasma sp.]
MRVNKGIVILIVLVSLLWMPLAMAEGTELARQALPIDLSGGAAPDPDGYIGEWEYEDPTIHVKIESGRADDCDYWVADIQIGHASQLRTAAADSFSSNMVLPGTTIAQRVNAVLAIDGDYYCYTRNGFIVRQGVLYRDRLEGKRDLLLIDEDGDFHFIRKAAKNGGLLEIDGKKVINAFFFGPVLVENGELNRDYRFDEMTFAEPCQRMCIAQVGPLHYKVVCCAAPYRGSSGMKIRRFAQLVLDLGIDNAYNLDGGDSTMMIFKGEKINDVDNPKTRNIADIIYFASSATGE